MKFLNFPLWAFDHSHHSEGEKSRGELKGHRRTMKGELKEIVADLDNPNGVFSDTDHHERIKKESMWKSVGLRIKDVGILGRAYIRIVRNLHHQDEKGEKEEEAVRRSDPRGEWMILENLMVDGVDRLEEE
ncbi:hypothetical protein EJ110_NYTH45854 [Nymphaea thermarum]|nr:hypothetical protein EJ110_NYTH45854 [Nymphaea thermarum]